MLRLSLDCGAAISNEFIEFLGLLALGLLASALLPRSECK